jgi:general stress protein 26
MKSKEEAVHDLDHSESVERMKEFVKHNKICMFTTHLTDVPLQSRPMSVQEVDDEGNFWFLSGASSNKNWEVEEDSRVQLIFANQKDYEFLSVYGHATIYADRQKIHDIWTPVAKAWFQQGENDPEATVIKVTPEDAYYWDTKNNKAVSLLKIMASVVTGKTMDDGEEGRMKL